MRSNTDQRLNSPNSKFKFMLLGCGCLRWSSLKGIKAIMTLTIAMRLLQFHIGQTVNNNEWSCTPGALARPLPLAGQHLAQGTHRDCWNSSSSCPCPPYYLVQDYPITLLLLLRLTPPACQDKWHHPLIHPSSAKHQTTQAPQRPQYSPISQNVCDPRLLLLLSPKHEGE